MIDQVYPFLLYLSKTPSSSAYTRISDAMIDPFLEELTSAVSPSDEPPAKRRRTLGFKDTPPYASIISKSVLNSRHYKHDGPVDVAGVRTAYLKIIFQLASSEGARDSNRKKLYTLWKAGMASASDENEAVEWDGS